jgi:hypothetical protein
MTGQHTIVRQMDLGLNGILASGGTVTVLRFFSYKERL